MTATDTLTRPVLVGMRCRTAERAPGAARGVELLVEALGEHLAVAPRLIGAPGEPRVQDYAADLRAGHGCLLEAGGQVDDALRADRLPLLVAGDCSIALTTLAPVAALRPDAKLLWLDAHADFHTPETSASGFLGEMCLAGACGQWQTGFPGRFSPARAVLCGVRALDDGERRLLERGGATVIGTTLETLVYLQNALDGAPAYVHLDLDVLDGEAFPARADGRSDASAGDSGLSAEKLYDLLDAVADSCELVGLELTGFDAPADEDDARALAELVVRTVEPLLPHEE